MLCATIAQKGESQLAINILTHKKLNHNLPLKYTCSLSKVLGVEFFYLLWITIVEKGIYTSL